MNGSTCAAWRWESAAPACAKSQLGDAQCVSTHACLPVAAGITDLIRAQDISIAFHHSAGSLQQSLCTELG